jgi:hypothetical protein
MFYKLEQDSHTQCVHCLPFHIHTVGILALLCIQRTLLSVHGKLLRKLSMFYFVLSITRNMFANKELKRFFRIFYIHSISNTFKKNTTPYTKKIKCISQNKPRIKICNFYLTQFRHTHTMNNLHTARKNAEILQVTNTKFTQQLSRKSVIHFLQIKPSVVRKYTQKNFKFTFSV